ncbi:hypothetical protein ACIBCA_19020 [Kitasatospora sp. NPDC051170]|uniref:hypothetical protein n=1 Tax=Kitasatospora sp. NPDC051170 TaxID=3364056 RepID=UPI00378CBDCB
MISMPAWGGSFTHAVAAGLTAVAVVGFGAVAVGQGADSGGGRTSPAGVIETDAQGHYLGAAGAPIWKSESDVSPLRSDGALA